MNRKCTWAEREREGEGKRLTDQFLVFLSGRFQCHTAEAAKLEAEVTKAQDTINAAQQLISQLDGEHKRWNTQVVWRIDTTIAIIAIL